MASNNDADWYATSCRQFTAQEIQELGQYWGTDEDEAEDSNTINNGSSSIQSYSNYDPSILARTTPTINQVSGDEDVSTEFAMSLDQPQAAEATGHSQAQVDLESSVSCEVRPICLDTTLRSSGADNLAADDPMAEPPLQALQDSGYGQARIDVGSYLADNAPPTQIGHALPEDLALFDTESNVSYSVPASQLDPALQGPGVVDTIVGQTPFTGWGNAGNDIEDVYTLCSVTPPSDNSRQAYYAYGNAASQTPSDSGVVNTGDALPRCSTNTDAMPPPADNEPQRVGHPGQARPAVAGNANSRSRIQKRAKSGGSRSAQSHIEHGSVIDLTTEAPEGSDAEEIEILPVPKKSRRSSRAAQPRNQQPSVIDLTFETPEGSRVQQMAFLPVRSAPRQSSRKTAASTSRRSSYDSSVGTAAAATRTSNSSSTSMGGSNFDTPSCSNFPPPAVFSPSEFARAERLLGRVDSDDTFIAGSLRVLRHFNLSPGPGHVDAYRADALLHNLHINIVHYLGWLEDGMPYDMPVWFDNVRELAHWAAVTRV